MLQPPTHLLQPGSCPASVRHLGLLSIPMFLPSQQFLHLHQQILVQVCCFKQAALANSNPGPFATHDQHGFPPRSHSPLSRSSLLAVLAGKWPELPEANAHCTSGWVLEASAPIAGTGTLSICIHGNRSRHCHRPCRALAIGEAFSCRNRFCCLTL
jgi:hypothetical protein